MLEQPTQRKLNKESACSLWERTNVHETSVVGKTEGKKKKVGRPKCEEKNNNIQVDLKDRLF